MVGQTRRYTLFRNLLVLRQTSWLNLPVVEQK